MMKTTRFRSYSLAAALAACLLTAGRVSADPVITDGGFEDPAFAANSLNDESGQAFDGWSGDSIGGATHEYIINGNIADLSGNDYGVTPFGAQYLGLNAVYRNSFRSIESQSVTGLTIGQAYTLTFAIANLDGATDPNMSAVASDGTTGSGTVLSQETVSAPKSEGPYGQGTIDFVSETLTFTAASDSVTFSIGNQSKTGTMGLDNVSLAAVPEPTTTAAMLMGTAALAGVVFRRRRAH